MSYIYSYFFPSSSIQTEEKVSFTPETFKLPPYFPSYTSNCEEKYLSIAKCINEQSVNELVKYENEVKEDPSLSSRSLGLSAELDQRVASNCFQQLGEYVNCMNQTMKINDKIEAKKFRVSFFLIILSHFLLILSHKLSYSLTFSLSLGSRRIS